MPPKRRKQPTTKPDEGKQKNTSTNTPKAQGKPGPAKKAQPKQAQPPTPKARITRMREDAEAVLNAVFGESVERDDADVITNEVVDEVVFDRDEVHRLATVLDDEVVEIKDSLKDNLIRLAEREVRVQRAVKDLQDALAASRQVANQLVPLESLAAKVGGGITLDTHPLTGIAWLRLQSAIAEPKPVPPVGGHHVTDPRRVNIDAIVAEITGRLRDISAILDVLNGRPGALPVDEIPNDLLAAVDRGDPGITKFLRALRSGLEQLPDANALKTLLNAADLPAEVPQLMSSATTAGAVLLDVLNACRATAPQGQPAPQGQAALQGNTELAGKLLKTVADSGQGIDFFLTGAGGQSLVNLRYAAVHGDPVWGGATVALTDLHFGPVGQPVPFGQIQVLAEPLPPLGEHSLPPLPGGLVRDRYVGGMPFGNTGGAMILPFVDNTTHVVIQYSEYDVRPFTFTYERGGERVVVGSDGNTYYTDDHYQTFRRIT
ncbi:ribonuclease domain-containing protein [Saccharothrix sp. NRRL B-16314]|uniref:ribonuclease domain-containing protein n=1 Tax=Saccharothrix sp. NRRL B-16314 TaxID=1463825 RepID=UPI00068CE9E0|nr:ribonuclease domain-containing protein [Saccharothrix sp. NRRL B-16314]